MYENNFTVNIIIMFSFSVSIEVGKIVSTGTSSNSSCNNSSESAWPNKKPLLVGLIVLALTAFIIILLTLYTYRLEMSQQSRIEQKENIWTEILFISETLYNEIISMRQYLFFIMTEMFIQEICQWYSSSIGCMLLSLLRLFV